MFPVPLVFTWSAALGATDPLFEFNAIEGFTIVGASLCGQTFTGSPTNFNLDVVDDGTDVLAGVCTHAVAGTPATWKTPHMGGTNAPVYVAAGSVVGITVNASGGSSPTIAKGAVVLYVLPGAV